MRSWPRAALWTLAAVLLLAAAGGLILSQREPKARGRSFTEWSEELQRKNPEAAPALRSIGPESVRFFTRQANRKEWLPPWRIRRRLPSRVQEWFESRNRYPMQALVNLMTLRDVGVDIHPALIPLVTHGNFQNPSVSDTAATRLFSELHQEELPGFFAAVAPNRELVRSQWASLTRAGPDHVNREVFAFFVSDPSPQVRRAALAHLPITPTNSAWLVPLLRKCLGDPAPVVRARAALNLARQGEAVDEALEAAKAVAAQPEAYEAVFALAALGERASNAVPELIQRLRTEEVSRPLRESPSAAAALGAIGPVALGALIPELKGTNDRSRLSAVIAIRNMRNPRTQAAPFLADLLKTARGDLRMVTAMTLAEMGVSTPEVKLALENCLISDDIYIRSDALRALRRLDPGRDWSARGE